MNRKERTVMNHSVRMFGVLRKYADANGFYSFPIEPGMTVSKLKTALKSKLTEQFPEFDEKIIDASAVGNQTEILSLDSVIAPTEEIAILPPVCGG